MVEKEDVKLFFQLVPDDLYDPDAWKRIPAYGRFQQKKGEDSEISFAPLLLDYLLLQYEEGDSLLDVACGAGTMAYFLEGEHLDLKYTGIDITPYYLELAKNKFPQHTWVEGDARNMPFDDKQFDYIFSVNLLQHLPKDGVRMVVEEMCRVTKKAIYLQAEFGEVRKENVQGSVFINEDDGTMPTFYYNTTAFEELDKPGWQRRNLMRAVEELKDGKWPSKNIRYDPGMRDYLIETLTGRLNQYVVLERKA